MIEHMSTMESPVRELAWFPPVVTSGGPLGEVQREATAIGRATAAQARAVAEFAALRPASADRQPGEPGCASAETRAARPRVLAEVSEWAAQELVVALQITQHAAQALLVRSLTLVHRLPATLEALEAGVIHPGHLWAFTERVGAIEDPGVRARVERGLLTWMTGRVTTPSQLTERARVLVLRHDALGAAQRFAAAVRRRGVFCSAGREDGLEQLNALLTNPEARACLDALGRYADSIEDGAAPRTRSQKMADCLVDLVLRPGETGLPVVTAQLTVVASVETLAGGDESGEVDGQVVPAEMVRHLACALGLLGEAPPWPRSARSTTSSAPAWSQARSRRRTRRRSGRAPPTRAMGLRAGQRLTLRCSGRGRRSSAPGGTCPEPEPRWWRPNALPVVPRSSTGRRPQVWWAGPGEACKR